MPSRLELVPETCDDGAFVEWKDGERFSLSAPILRVTLGDLLDEQRLTELRRVFTHWVRLDREDIDLRRFGLLRFRMPPSYKVNEVPESGIGEIGNFVPNDDCLRRGIRTLVESVECIGGQLGGRGDRRGALLAALLADHVQKRHARLIDPPMRAGRLSGQLAMIVADGLNKRVDKPVDYRYAGLDQVHKCLDADPLVHRFVNNGTSAQPGA